MNVSSRNDENASVRVVTRAIVGPCRPPFWSDTYRDSWSWERRRAAIFAAPICSLARCCARDGDYCRVRVADLHAGGSPCWDWSRIGNQAGLLGATVAIFWSWCAVVRQEESPLVIHENVCQFPMWLLYSAFGNLYTIHEFVLCPAHHGFPLISRTRRYLILTHIVKTKVLRPLEDTYDVLSKALERHTTNTPVGIPTINKMREAIM